MKRLVVLWLAFASIVPAFSVRAQEISKAAVVTSVRKVFPESVRVGIGSIIFTSRGYMFAGAGPGGYVWRSSDFGNTWKKLTSGIGGWAMVSELIETDSGSILAGNPDGVYRSTDNGDHWKGVVLDEDISSEFVKNRNGDIFVGTGNAAKPLYRSTDEGRTWTLLAEGILDSSRVQGLCISQEGWLYFGAGGFMPTLPYERGEGMFLSTDNGATWRVINNGLPVVSGQIPIWPVATGQSGYRYVGVLTKGIYRSTDYGESWQESNGDNAERYPTALHVSREGYVFAGFDNAWPGKGGVYLSLDRGNSWRYIGMKGMGIIWALAFSADSSCLFVGTHQDGVWRIDLNLVTKVEEVSDVPSAFALLENYPNPFNPSTTIEFTLPERALITLTVMNLLGQEVATLVNEEVSAGTHQATWNASELPSGVHFARIEAKNFVATRKMVLLR
ncbi:MAG: T9SS type A sorting domain-containing protein [Candidatus Brennerbacteria bacterium]